MTTYEDEHPYRMKFFEIAVDSLIGIAGMMLCTWISKKVKDCEKKHVEAREAEDEEMVGVLNRSVTATTMLTDMYGTEWMKDPKARKAYDTYVQYGIFDDHDLDGVLMERTEIDVEVEA